MRNDEVIHSYFAAMRRGAAAEADLLDLFHADATYVEPFSIDRPAIGIDEIRQRFRKGWEFPLPDLELEVLAIEVDGPVATSRWECRSPGLPRPVRGEDRYEIRDGRIVKLEVTLLDDDSSP